MNSLGIQNIVMASLLSIAFKLTLSQVILYYIAHSDILVVKCDDYHNDSNNLSSIVGVAMHSHTHFLA